MNVKKHRKLSKRDLDASVDIFHDCVATCAGHIESGRATDFPTQENFKLYLLMYSECEFRKYLRLKDDYFLLPYRKGEKGKRVEIQFGDISHYTQADDVFDTLYPEAEYTQADVEALQSVPDHVTQILEKLYLEDKTQAEAALELNISRDRVKNVLLHHKTKLRAKRNSN
jgi:DNA-directed RNA polymerase specialized sigma24 family protein